MAGGTARLDNFTDAAFAFALSLLVVGHQEAPTSTAMLQRALADVPAFAFGFGIIAMFWATHVRWRRIRGDGSHFATLLTLALVFVVLIYIQPLQAMASSLSSYMGGTGTRFTGDLPTLFLIYGVGFTAMAALTMLLFLEARRDEAVPMSARIQARGEAIIWLIIAVTGLLSMICSRLAAIAILAPYLYATLPFTIGLFAWRYRWPD